MFTEAQNFAIVQTELDGVFFQNFDYESATPGQATSRTGEIFKPLNTDHAAYIEQIYKGSELFAATGETAGVSLTTPKVANKLTTYIVDFTKGVELSKNLFDDNMHGVWAKTVADLAIKARLTQDDNAFKWFRGAFTTSLTADGAAFCASHTLIGGGTQSNVVSGALSPTTLNTAIVSLAEQKDQAGIIMGNQPSILLVAVAGFKHALEITQSALIADVANNNLNVYRSAYGITVYTSPFLGAASGGSDTAWFLLARNHSVTRLIRQGIQTSLRDWSYSNNRTYFYQANFRETVYAPDYVGVVGSTGL
jgi:hypothetical protein